MRHSILVFPKRQNLLQNIWRFAAEIYLLFAIFLHYMLSKLQQFPVEIWVVDLQRVMRFSEIGFRRLFSGLFLFLSFS